jgi:hypothetical protein
MRNLPKNNPISWAINSLAIVGVDAAYKGWSSTVRTAADSLCKVGIKAAADGRQEDLNLAVKSLEEVGKAAASKGLGGAFAATTEALDLIGVAAIGKEWDEASASAAESLTNVWRAAAPEGLKVPDGAQSTYRPYAEAVALALLGIGATACDPSREAKFSETCGIARDGLAQIRLGLGQDFINGIGRSRMRRARGTEEERHKHFDTHLSKFLEGLDRA